MTFSDRTRSRLRMRVAVVTGALALGALVVPGAAAPPACAEDGTVAVVVRGDDGVERGACVPAGKLRTGLDALQATGVAVVTRDFGGRLGKAVCSVAGEGNAVSECPGVAGHWHYWRHVDGRWAESEQGPSNSEVEPAVAEGWTWVEGATVAPPEAPADSICELPRLGAQGAAAPPSGRSPGSEAEGDGGGSVGALAGFVGAVAVIGAVGVTASRRRRAAP